MSDHGSYTEHACTLAVSGWDIPAALTLPETDGPLPSAIVLVPGSLFSDVNGDYPVWNSFPHVYAHLAHQLSARGHAVYRFAKLGPGTGSTATDADASAKIRTWDGRLVIAMAALDAMRRELESRGVHAERIIGAGHSEGSVVVSQLAASGAGEVLDGLVLLAGPSVGLLEIMREQVGMSLPADQVADELRRLDEVIGYVRRGEPVPEHLAAGADVGASALVTMPEDARRYMRESDAVDPAALASTLEQPVLVVHGGADTNVPPHHGERLRDGLLARAHGIDRTTFVLVPEVSHMLKLVPPELSGPAAFGYAGETDPRVTDAIDLWIRGL